MRTRTLRTEYFVDAGVGLLVVRAALPLILTWLANLGVRRIPGYRASIRRVNLHVTTPRLVVTGVLLVQLNGEHSLQINSLVIGSSWRDLLHRSLIAYLKVESPRVLLDVQRLNQARAHSGQAKTNRKFEAKDKPPWQAKVMNLPAFRISTAAVIDGEVHLLGLLGQNGTDVKADRFNLSIDNITNSLTLAPTLLAKAVCSARVMTNGSLILRAEGYPLAEQPTFNLDFQTENIDLNEVREIIESDIEIEVRRGILDLYIEAAAAKGYIEGYAKVISDHLEVVPPSPSTFFEKVKAWTAEAIVKLGKNKQEDRVATRLDFEGSLVDPDLDIIDAILSFFRNGFSSAERAALDNRIWFSRTGKTGDEVEIHDGREPHSKAAVTFGLISETFHRWIEDAAPRMAAALAYYTTFSMAPLLILAISIAGLALGREAAQGKIVEEIGGLVGKQSAATIQSMIRAANHSSKGIFASVVGIISLIAGATGVLSELKSALNKIWRTEERGDVKEIVKKNVVFLGMVLGMGFLLTVSLIVSAALAALGHFFAGFLPAQELILHIVDFALSFGIITVLFAAMYRFLPNTTVEWRDVWIGAMITSLLFNFGKLGLGLYLGKGAVGSSYGAAGSILILLLWIYYSGLIFYFGAEFTKVYTERSGSSQVKRRSKRISGPKLREIHSR
jgi:membrane protein